MRDAAISDGSTPAGPTGARPDGTDPVADAAWPTITAQYPSADFPPTPAFRLSVPVGWRGIPATAAEMLVVAPRLSDGYQTNVVVTTGRVPATATPQRLLADSILRMADRPGTELIDDVVDPQVPTPARATTTRYALDDSTVVECHQLHVYVPSAPRSAHVVTVTGTVAASAPPHERDEVQRVVRSLQLPLAALGDEAADT